MLLVLLEQIDWLIAHFPPIKILNVRVEVHSNYNRVGSNSGISAAKWVDNKTVQVASKYIGIEPMGTI